MFRVTRCEVEGCTRFAVGGETRCAQHLPRKDDVLRRMAEQLTGRREHDNISLIGLEFRNLDIRERVLTNGVFSDSSFHHITFAGGKIRFCYFEFCHFTGCDFSGTDILFSTFAGTVFDDCTFVGSDILHTNFNAARASDCRFDDCDLYYSRFIGATLQDVSYLDCNLKKASFAHSKRTNVNFKYSNYEEAEFGGSWGGIG